jgi:hypothetical protein
VWGDLYQSICIHTPSTGGFLSKLPSPDKRGECLGA